MTLEAIKSRMADVKQRAGFFVTTRRKDLALYAMLAEALSVCEQVEAEGLEEALREDIAQRAVHGKNRSYVERNVDIYVVVGRFIFEPEINRAAAWRYCATLREAAKAGLRSDDMELWLRENGGINALFKSRPVKARTARTKTLHLNQQIEIPKGRAFTIRIARDHRGFFDVVGGPDDT
jgi:hypothetical protein